MKRLISLVISCAVLASVVAQSDVQKADMLYDMRDYSLAITSYEKALADDPDNMEIQAMIAQCYIQMQDYLKASQWYEKFVDREGVSDEDVLEYAHVLKSLRLYAKARFYYQKAGVGQPELAEHFTYGCDIAKVEMKGDPFYTIETMSVNSRSADFAPCVHNKDLFFSSLRTDLPAPASTRKSRGGKTLSRTQTVFASEKFGTKEVVSMDMPATGDQVVSHVRYSEDGKWVAFMTSDMRDGQRLFDDRPGKVSMYVGRVSSNGSWEKVMPFEHNGNDFSNGYPGFSPDGSVLYFASTRGGGQGGWDIWLSFRSMDGWTTPVNAGDMINTPGNEISPYYSDHMLFFSSDWHPGIGGFDIFKAHSSEGQWTNVRSMGYPLNSPKDDIDFVWEPIQRMGYFASNRIGTTGGYDIYMAKPEYEEVLMTVYDQDGQEPVAGAMIKFLNGAGAPVTTDVNGQVYIHQHFDRTTDLVIKHKGYKELSMTIKTPGEGPAKYDVYIDRSLMVDAEEPVVAEAETPADNMSDNIANTTTPTGTSASKSTASTNTDPQVTEKVTKVVVGNPEATSGTVSTSDGEYREIVTDKPARVEQVKPNNYPVRDRYDDMKPQVGMFAVQIAAVGKPTSLDQYGSLGTIGKVMQYPENGLYKVRVGYYKDEASAKNALNSIKKSGYPDAFIVTATPVDEAAAAAETESKGTYYVRLGTYSRPEFFDATKVEHLGKVYREKSGQYTIMLLGEFASVLEAKKAIPGAAKAGFKDAYIVDKDLVKVKM